MARPEPKLITFEIDGREVRAPEGAILVDAAKLGDVEIPYFCYEPKLGKPVGACRMCLVEIEGMPKLQTSCSTPVKDGMVVNTTSDRVKHAQNAIVEFLLINHPLDCPVCDKGGECPLQDISFGWGAGRSRFIEPKRHFKKPLELSPLVAIDRERCILCYRCVRFSQEVSEDYQLVFLDRADHTFVGTHDGHPYIAPFSGNIIELCPVGALTSTAYRFRARPWDIEDSGSVCMLCPSQCNVKFTVRDDARVVRVLARDNEDVDDGWLCDKGRFGYQAIHAKERITAPLVRDGGYLREVSWERALSEATAALKRAGERTAAIVGGQTTNEEGFLVQHLMRNTLGSPHVDSRPAGAVDARQARALAQPALAAAVPDIDHADAILVLETELVDEAPILDLRVRKAVRRNGARLVVASSRPSTLDTGAAAILRYAPGSAEAATAALASALGSSRARDLDLDELARAAGAMPGRSVGVPANGSGPDEARAAAAGSREGAPARPEAGSGPALMQSGDAGAPSGAVPSPADAVSAAAEALRGAESVVVLWSERLSYGERGAQAVEALLALAGALGIADTDDSGLIEIPSAANGRGLREVGCLPGLGPGLADAEAAGMRSHEIVRAAGDEVQALVLVHADTERDLPDRGLWPDALERAAAVIAFADFRTESLEEHAQVVFPAESYAEKEGTITHPDGRVQRVRQAIGRPNQVRAEWSVLAELSARLDAPLDVPSRGGPEGVTPQSVPAVTAAVADAVPFYAGLTLDEIGGRGVRWQERDAAAQAPAAETSEEPLASPPAAPDSGTLHVTPVNTLWTGRETEHAPSLQFLSGAARAELSPDDARRLGLRTGDEVVLAVNGDRVHARASVRTGVRAGAVFVAPPVLPAGAVEVIKA
jgi:NADH-quinone oxidoreductase subunit G